MHLCSSFYLRAKVEAGLIFWALNVTKPSWVQMFLMKGRMGSLISCCAHGDSVFLV